MADEQRIAVLEQHVRLIYEQLAALRAELDVGSRGASFTAHPEKTAVAEPASAGQSRTMMDPELAPRVERIFEPRPEQAPPPPASPPPHKPAPRRPVAPLKPDIDLEAFIGRYGTIAVASLAILMGVGTFLSWAIEHGLLGPLARVVLGFIGAGLVAAVGVWVREKHDVRFGGLLLSLSLAIVHVDAWAAGPHLRVIPTTVALAIAAFASAALAALALTSEERTLFSIGFGGAMIAPFVTASEPGSVVILLTYGWVIIASTIFAIRERGWEVVMWLTVIAAFLYVGVATAVVVPHSASWLTGHSPILFPFACAAAALLFARDALRSHLALAYLLIGCGAAIWYASSAPRLEYILPLAGTLAAYIIARELETEQHLVALGNIVVPLGFLGAIFVSPGLAVQKAIAALVLTVMAAVLAWDGEEDRPHHLLVAAITSALAIVIYLADYDVRLIGAIALHAMLFSILLRTTKSKILILPIALELVVVFGWAMILLSNRPTYQYTPFESVASLCAFGVTSAFAALALALKPSLETNSYEDQSFWTAAVIFTIGAAFVWVRQELVEAYSRDIATFALIIYYALTGLALIFAGRAYKIGALRAVGLGLAFYAGYKALAETFQIDSIGLRVGARILVGVFLAAVAYWYRVPKKPDEEIAVPVAAPIAG